MKRIPSAGRFETTHEHPFHWGLRLRCYETWTVWCREGDREIRVSSISFCREPRIWYRPVLNGADRMTNFLFRHARPFLPSRFVEILLSGFGWLRGLYRVKGEESSS
jgi:hypothetical protein